jgi:hypothetical protein
VGFVVDKAAMGPVSLVFLVPLLLSPLLLHAQNEPSTAADTVDQIVTDLPRRHVLRKEAISAVLRGCRLWKYECSLLQPSAVIQ